MGCPGSEVEELRLVMGELEMGGSGDGEVLAGVEAGRLKKRMEM